MTACFPRHSRPTAVCLTATSWLRLRAAAAPSVRRAPTEQIETERFLFYAVASLPSESLTLLYTNTDSLGARLRPSIGVLRVEALFPALQRRVFGRNPADLLFSRRSVAERLRLLPDPAPIRALLAEQGMPPLPDEFRSPTRLPHFPARETSSV